MLLQHSQQFGLLGQWHAFDFIQKQGATIGVLQLADTLALGAGKGAAFMAEQFGFKQLLGDCRAVEGHKGLVGTWAKIMQAAGDQLLAAAGLAANQHIDGQRRQFQDLTAQGLQAARYPKQAPVDLLTQARLLMQAAVFQYQLALFQRAAQAAEQGFGAEGLFQKVVGTITHGLHGHGYIAMAGQQDHRQIRVQLLQPGQQGQAAHARHAHIADNHSGKMRRQPVQTVFGVVEKLHVKAAQAQPLFDGIANTGLIIDHDHRVEHVSRFLCDGQCQRELRAINVIASSQATTDFMNNGV